MSCDPTRLGLGAIVGVGVLLLPYTLHSMTLACHTSSIICPATAAAAGRGEGEEGPRFVYGNAAALGLFECTWDELIGTPSTRSAEPKEEASVPSCMNCLHAWRHACPACLLGASFYLPFPWLMTRVGWSALLATKSCHPWRSFSLVLFQ